MQVDGVNFVEYHSFNAFNETTRLKKTVKKHEKLIGKCTHLGADGIYPTNKNRKFCSSEKIQTNFVKKGPVKDDKQTKEMEALLNKERSTRLEGSFGTEKEHYGLRKIKAKTSKTQIVWMYFGIFTANAVLIAKRKASKNKERIQKAAMMSIKNEHHGTIMSDRYKKHAQMHYFQKIVLFKDLKKKKVLKKIIKIKTPSYFLQSSMGFSREAYHKNKFLSKV